MPTVQELDDDESVVVEVVGDASKSDGKESSESTPGGIANATSDTTTTESESTPHTRKVTPSSSHNNKSEEKEKKKVGKKRSSSGDSKKTTTQTNKKDRKILPGQKRLESFFAKAPTAKTPSLAATKIRKVSDPKSAETSRTEADDHRNDDDDDDNATNDDELSATIDGAGGTSQISTMDESRRRALRDICLGRKLSFSGKTTTTEQPTSASTTQTAGAESSPAAKPLESSSCNETRLDSSKPERVAPVETIDMDESNEENKKPEQTETHADEKTSDKPSDDTIVDLSQSNEVESVQQTKKPKSPESSTKSKPAPPATSNSRKSNSKPAQSSVNLTKAQKDHSTPQDHTDVTKATAPVEISEDDQAILSKHQNLRDTNLLRAQEIMKLCSDGLEEENVELPIPDKEDVPEGKEVSATEFPDFAVNCLAILVEGRREPLSTLSDFAVDKLRSIYSTEAFRHDTVTDKIKRIANRKGYTKNLSFSHSDADAKGSATKNVDVFEDDSDDNMWRWEVTVLDLLPGSVQTAVKKARAARKKRASHLSALSRLLAAMRDVDQLILRPQRESSKPASKTARSREELLAKVSQEEEKVLKFERELEKIRLAEAAKRQRQSDMREKQQMAEAKRLEKEQKKQEQFEEKQKKLALEAAKQEQAKKEQEAREAKAKKQKAVMKNFFSARTTSKAAAPSSKANKDSAGRESAPQESSPEVVAVPEPLERRESPQSTANSKPTKSHRKRRSKKVQLTVNVTVYPDDPFMATAPYDEKRKITVRNKYKFLQFHEDVRPPYYGTWSKPSKAVTGRRPFGKDTVLLDYDHDSEAEWEEGDDDLGEDVENDNGDDDDDNLEDEGEMEQDGWLAGDDEVDGEVDEDTILLRKKKMEQASAARSLEQTVCIVAPRNGAPLSHVDDATCGWNGFVEGFENEEAKRLLLHHSSIELDVSPIVLDAFPPEETDTPSGPTTGDGNKTTEMSAEDTKAFARFVHLCELPSKDKVVEEFRNQQGEQVSGSRAHMLRLLDSMAEKKKRKQPEKGSVTSYSWKVKKSVLQDLELTDLVDGSSETTDKAAAKDTQEALDSKADSSTSKAAANANTHTLLL